MAQGIEGYLREKPAAVGHEVADFNAQSRPNGRHTELTGADSHDFIEPEKARYHEDD